MKDNYILTAESVTEGHPDKLCDTIADAVVDACLKHDPSARVACEVMATAGKITAAGEITAVKLPDIPSIICKTVQRAGYGGSDYEVEVITHEQSPDIAGAVKGTQDTGAGDQGIVYGYACDETPEFLPLPVVFAHRLTRMLSHVRVLGIVPSCVRTANPRCRWNTSMAAPGASLRSCCPASMKRMPISTPCAAT